MNTTLLVASRAYSTLKGTLALIGLAALATFVVVPGPREPALRMARMCYDHIAGRLGLAIAEQLQAERAIEFDGEAGLVTEQAGPVLARWGLSLAPEPPAARRARPYCRPCLDWSERKPHLAGRLGAMVCAHCLDQGWLRREADSRALGISARGAAALRALLGLEAWRKVTGEPPSR